MKKNCWEHKKCGRERGGENSAALGICPASTDDRLHDVHQGKNSGRTCWMIAGTLCGGQVQGTFGMKYKNCEICDFYNQVKQEEGPNYQLTIFLLSKLKGRLVAV